MNTRVSGVVVQPFKSCDKCQSYFITYRDIDIYDNNMIFLCNSGDYAKEETRKEMCNNCRERDLKYTRSMNSLHRSVLALHKINYKPSRCENKLHRKLKAEVFLSKCSMCGSGISVTFFFDVDDETPEELLIDFNCPDCNSNTDVKPAIVH